MSDRPTILLQHHLKELRLPTFLRECDRMAQQCAAEGVDHPDYLLRLSELELIDRHHRMVERRIKAARFPTVKSLDTFEFLAIPSVNKQLVTRLAVCEYVERRENVIAMGNSGTGKTHMALGLGLAACQRGLSVGFTTAAALVNELMEARDERRLLNFQKRLSRLKLLIIDELGFVPLSKRVSKKWGRVLTASASVSSWHCRSTPRWSPAVLHSPCSADGSVPAMQMFSQPPIFAATPRTDGCLSDASQSPAPNPIQT